MISTACKALTAGAVGEGHGCNPTVEDDASWLESLEQTRWLEAVQQALRSSARVAEELELGRRSVMLTGARVDAPRGWSEGGEGGEGGEAGRHD